MAAHLGHGGRSSPTRFGTVLLQKTILLDRPIINEGMVRVKRGESGRFRIQFPGISLPAEPALALARNATNFSEFPLKLDNGFLAVCSLAHWREARVGMEHCVRRQHFKGLHFCGERMVSPGGRSLRTKVVRFLVTTTTSLQGGLRSPSWSSSCMNCLLNVRLNFLP